MTTQNLRARLWHILEPTDDREPAARWVAIGISVLVVINVLAVVIETLPSVTGPLVILTSGWIERVSLVVFTVEYGARLWASGADPRYAGPWGRVRYAMTPMAIIDLMAIAPAFVPASMDLRTLRLVRVLRFLRILKLGRTSRALQTLGRALYQTRSELTMCGAVAIVLLLMASSLIYFAEREAQPEVFASIPEAMWWATATLTTVGYGDVVPVTPLGRVLGAFIAFLGIGLFALPTGVLGAAFMKELESIEPRCPHCGKALNDPPE